MTPPLETKRLFLVPLQLEDAKQVQPLFGHWDVVKYLSDGVAWPFPDEGAHAYYRDFAIPAMERGEEWHWTLRLKESPDEIIGSVALLRSERNNRAFLMGIPWRKRGLMTEAVEAVTEFWFSTLGFETLRAPKAAANLASLRISAKTGMHLESKQEQGFVCGRLPSETWVITREEWFRARRSS